MLIIMPLPCRLTPLLLLWPFSRSDLCLSSWCNAWRQYSSPSKYMADLEYLSAGQKWQVSSTRSADLRRSKRSMDICVLSQTLLESYAVYDCSDPQILSSVMIFDFSPTGQNFTPQPYDSHVDIHFGKG
ncbi:hypothetical protein BKA82DRAFT_4153927 [Pisolithus tinctorius]|nr:hypothetical protein BKA82DRAFT_4153927 [Pisolithus tinctorius]